jgi:phospholipid/cholesterol/gamma-HCH transport system substrate-binding protein
MKRNPIETIVGALVLLVAAWFLVFAYRKVDLNPAQGYSVVARFNKSGGITPGSDIMISGIKVGSVHSVKLDSDYYAVVTMTIYPDVPIPDDTEVSINSDGLMGGKYIKLLPGRSAVMLVDGGSIRKVKDYKALEDMVGDLIFQVTGGGQ